MHANAEAKRSLRVLARVQDAERILYIDSALDGLYSAGELSQDAITSRVSNPSPVLCNKPVHHLPMNDQGTEGPDLIQLHKA
jgi:hypothetical protein